MDRLNAEVGAFYDYMTPTAHEHQLRAEIIAEVASVITKRYPDAEVRPFGSFATQSYLPFGDIDLVVSSPAMTTRPTKKTLFEIAAMLKTRRIAQDVIVIHRAKVPIVKARLPLPLRCIGKVERRTVRYHTRPDTNGHLAQSN